MRTRLASPGDLAFVTQDGYAPEAHVAHLITEGRVWIAEEEARPIGYLRLELLWGHLPFIALIRVLPDHRHRGAGRALLAAVERHLAGVGAAYCYSSSQADEAEPQGWHRHMGFAECGFLAGVNADGVGEVFFRKKVG